MKEELENKGKSFANLKSAYEDLKDEFNKRENKYNNEIQKKELLKKTLEDFKKKYENKLEETKIIKNKEDKDNQIANKKLKDLLMDFNLFELYDEKQREFLLSNSTISSKLFFLVKDIQRSLLKNAKNKEFKNT